MPRNKRVWFPGATYHIMSRGNRKERIFLNDHDYRTYLKIHYETMKKYNYYIYSYCLMPNHVHLQLRADVEIWKIMRAVNYWYARYFNSKYDYVGHLFQGRYKSKLIKNNSYMLQISRYIHRNPLEAEIVNSIEKYQWSSYPVYLGKKTCALTDTELIISLTPNKNISDYRKFVEKT